MNRNIYLFFLLLLKTNFLFFQKIKESRKKCLSFMTIREFRSLSLNQKLKKITKGSFKSWLCLSLAHTASCGLDQYAQVVYENNIFTKQEISLSNRITNLLIHIPYRLVFSPIAHIVISPTAIIDKRPDYFINETYFISQYYLCPTYTYADKFVRFFFKKERKDELEEILIDKRSQNKSSCYSSENKRSEN